MWGADGLACHPLSGVLQVSFNNGEGWIIGKPPIMLHTAVSATCILQPWRPRSVPTSSVSTPMRVGGFRTAARAGSASLCRPSCPASPPPSSPPALVSQSEGPRGGVDVVVTWSCGPPLLRAWCCGC